MEVGHLSALRTKPLSSSEFHPRTMLSLEQYMAALVEAEAGRDHFSFEADPAPRTIVEELRPTLPARPAVTVFGSIPVPAMQAASA